MGTVIVVLLVAVAATALTLLINRAGDWVDERIGWWVGGFIALLAGSAITLILVNAAKQAGKQLGGG
jgi:Ca2+/H+ antiporter